MSIYFLEDARLFGFLWLSITLLELRKNGWQPPCTLATFEMDCREAERLVGNFSLLRTTFPENAIHAVLMVVPALRMFLDLFGAALAVLLLDVPILCKALLSAFALVILQESFRRSRAFSALVRGHLLGFRIPVMRRHRSLFYGESPLGRSPDFCKMFLAAAIVLFS